jgi:hypothetical protein
VTRAKRSKQSEDKARLIPEQVVVKEGMVRGPILSQSNRDEERRSECIPKIIDTHLGKESNAFQKDQLKPNSARRHIRLSACLHG